MIAYSHNSLLTELSKTSSDAIMLVTVSPELVDGKHIATTGALSALNDDALDLLIIEGGTIVLFKSIEEAMEVYQNIQASLNKLEYIDLMISVYYGGYNQLNLFQDKEFAATLDHPCSTAAYM